MQRDFRLVLTLICAVSFIYVLRDSDTSPGGFLKQQISRILDDTTFSQKYCDGINLATAISSSQQKEANGVKNVLSKIRKGNPLINFIEGPEPRSEFDKKYAIPALVFGAPWIIFFVISVLVCFGYLINWCCMYCSCCGCIKCCQLPTNSKGMRGYAGASLFFGVAVIAVSIAGIILSRGVSYSGRATLCAGVTLIEKLTLGDDKTHWLGVKPLADKLYIVLSNYDNTTASITANFGTTGYFQAAYTTSGTNTNYGFASSAVDTFYNDYQGEDIARSDPVLSSTNYVPTYIENLGPTSNITTNAGLIKNEMTDKNTRVSTAATTTDSNIYKLQAAGIALRDALQKSEESAQNSSISMSKLIAKIDPAASKAKTGFNAIGGGLLGLFVLEGVLALFAMASIGLVCKGARSFNKGVHLSWCCLALLSLLTWILATVTFPLSLVLFEVCDASNLLINNATFFNKTFDKFLPADATGEESNPLSGVTGIGNYASDDDDKDSTNKTITKARKILYNCLFAEKDLLVILNATDTIDLFDSLMSPMDDVADLTATSTNTVVNSVQIPLQINSAISYKTGTKVDAPEVTTDLSTLNGYTNPPTAGCTSVQDTWVLNSTLCKSGMGTVFSGVDPTSNIGKPTCIGFDAWGSNNIGLRYTVAQFPTANCANVNGQARYQYLQSFVNNFVTNRDTVESLFSKIQSGSLTAPTTPSLTSISTLNDNLMTSIEQATNPYKTLRQITTNWYYAISDPNVGMKDNSKCTFVRQSIQDLHDTMCTGFIVDLFQSSAAIIVISFMSTFSFFMLFCLAKRFISSQKYVQKRKNQA